MIGIYAGRIIARGRNGCNPRELPLFVNGPFFTPWEREANGINSTGE
jgi:hypothetical protein